MHQGLLPPTDPGTSRAFHRDTLGFEAGAGGGYGDMIRIQEPR